jgi:hypothetical protein
MRHQRLKFNFLKGFLHNLTFQRFCMFASFLEIIMAKFKHEREHEHEHEHERDHAHEHEREH